MNSEITSLKNLKECVRSSASVASSVSTILVEKDRTSSIGSGSDFEDVFPSEPSETLRRFIAAKAVPQYESEGHPDPELPVDQPKIAAANASTEIANLDLSSDSDDDLEAELARALFNTGKERFLESNYASAERALRTCLSKLPLIITTRESNSPSPLSNIPSRIEVMGLLFQCCKNQQKWAEAKKLLTEKISIRERRMGRTDFNVLADLLVLVEILIEKQDLVEAQLYARRALNGYRKIGASGVEGTEMSLRSLVHLCHLKGELEEEEAYSIMLNDFLESKASSAPESSTTSPTNQQAREDTNTLAFRTVNSDINVFSGYTSMAPTLRRRGPPRLRVRTDIPRNLSRLSPPAPATVRVSCKSSSSMIPAPPHTPYSQASLSAGSGGSASKCKTSPESFIYTPESSSSIPGAVESVSSRWCSVGSPNESTETSTRGLAVEQDGTKRGPRTFPEHQASAIFTNNISDLSLPEGDISAITPNEDSSALNRTGIEIVLSPDTDANYGGDLLEPVNKPVSPISELCTAISSESIPLDEYSTRASGLTRGCLRMPPRPKSAAETSVDSQLKQEIFCYICERKWSRQQNQLECPYCDSEFSEFLASSKSVADVEDGKCANPRLDSSSFVRHTQGRIPISKRNQRFSNTEEGDQDPNREYLANEQGKEEGLPNEMYQCRASAPMLSTHTRDSMYSSRTQLRSLGGFSAPTPPTEWGSLWRHADEVLGASDPYNHSSGFSRSEVTLPTTQNYTINPKFAQSVANIHSSGEVDIPSSSMAGTIKVSTRLEPSVSNVNIVFVGDPYCGKSTFIE